MESVKVLGLVNITVLAAGSIFTGTVHEPIKVTKNPQKMLDRKSTRLNSSHIQKSRMPSSA